MQVGLHCDCNKFDYAFVFNWHVPKLCKRIKNEGAFTGSEESSPVYTQLVDISLTLPRYFVKESVLEGVMSSLILCTFV